MKKAARGATATARARRERSKARDGVAMGTEAGAARRRKRRATEDGGGEIRVTVGKWERNGRERGGALWRSSLEKGRSEA